MANAINRGQRLGATLVNRMAAAAMGAGQFRVSSGRGSGGPLGTSMSIPLPQLPDDNVIACIATSTQYAFTVVEVEGAKLIDELRPIPICGLCSRDAPSKLGVLLSNSVPDQIVPVQISGVCLAKYEWDAGDNLAAGGRLLGMSNRPYAVQTQGVESHGGPLHVVAVAAHDAEWSDYNFALVMVTKKRLGTVYVRDLGSRVYGQCDVLVVGTGYTVTEISKGVLDIE